MDDGLSHDPVHDLHHHADKQAHGESDDHSFQASDKVEFVVFIGVHKVLGSRNNQFFAVAYPDPVDDKTIIPVNNEPDEI